jgi:bifunctional UDP-N-acetylglucosamine pyrophosphorylase/glucosamine-1-phosphate N-acetyltransferase
MELAVIVLAAGIGKRMKSRLPKVLHPVLGRPMLSYVIDAVRGVFPRRLIFVIGYGAESVKKTTNQNQIEYVIQSEQLGTGHAVCCAKKTLQDFEGNIVILNGDFPLIRSETLKRFIDEHNRTMAAVSILTNVIDNPYGYGRVIRSAGGDILRVVEEKDATPQERKLKEINSGAYCVESGFLWEALEQIGTENKQQEYYLPDIVNVASRNGKKVIAFIAPDSEEVLGVNNRAELAAVEQIIRRRTNSSLLISGVTIVNSEVTYISPQVSIGADTLIYPNTFVYGNTKIGNGCVIGPCVWIEDSQIGNEVTIKFSSYINEALIEDRVTIGPFAHIRPETNILSGAKIGNFVEIKKSKVGRGSKVPHLSYVGDATLGEGVNIGAGTITCNYDGFQKHETIINDDVFIGSDTMLVAPVEIGKGATTGAGSTITKDVPPGALAIGRAKQVIIKDWKRKPKEREEDE